MSDLLANNPLLVVFIVAALGYGLGAVPIAGSRFGVSAVLFVGLGFGVCMPALDVPDILFSLGVVLAIYTLGLESGPSFFAAFRQDKSREMLVILLTVVVPLVLSVVAMLLLGLQSGVAVGLFTGVATHAPSMVSLLDYIASAGITTVSASSIIIGFSISLPVGIVGRVMVLSILKRLWRVDTHAEALTLRREYPFDKELVPRVILITNPAMTGLPLRYLMLDHAWEVVFGRVFRNGSVELVGGNTVFEKGDMVTAAGTLEALDDATQALGEATDTDVARDYSALQLNRFFVSNTELVGMSIGELPLREQFHASITNVRRGDTELLASASFRLSLGDRVRVVSRPENMPALRNFFGDSYAALSSVNLLSLGLGITLGLLVGMVQFVLPGGLSFSLGLAGGPLVVALMLGALRRTGQLVWTLPYSANRTLQQFAMILFLSVIGVRSGQNFFSTLITPEGLMLLGISSGITLLSAVLVLTIGYKLLRVPFSLLAGMTAMHPAVLSYAEELAQNPLPNYGMAFSMPISLVLRVIMAQILLIILAG